MAKRKKRTQFRVRIADCGTDQAYFSYSTLKDDNAALLIRDAVKQMMDATVAENSYGPFQYDLACLLLSELNTIPDSLKKDIEDVRERLKVWNIRRPHHN